MTKFLAFLIPLACLGHTSLNAAENDWTEPFKEPQYLDYYITFLEETEPKEVFEFKADNTLAIHGKDHSIGYIQTLDEYENYEITFEWRWPDTPGKSGILIHSSADTAHSIWPEGIKIQLEEDNVGDFWLFNSELEVTEEQMPKKAAERNRRLKLKRVRHGEGPWKENLENKPGKWNEMRIVLKDDTIKVFLNKELVNEGTEASRTSGFITLFAEETNIEFRNIRLRELD